MYRVEPGLTLREFFAAMAMQGLIDDRRHLPMTPENTPNTEALVKNVAHWSVRYADALIEELNRPCAGGDERRQR